MPIVRVARMTPVRGQRGEVLRLQQQILEIDAAQPGFILGFQYADPAPQGRMGRVIVWEREEDANRTTRVAGFQALRSQLHGAIEPGHTEELYPLVGEVLRPRGSQ